MSRLPTGTVTYLFTDVEGSTRLWEQHPRAMGPAMARHDELIEEVVQRQGDYYGPAVNRAARLRAAAHGGQTLLSQATEQLVRDGLPPGVALTDLGEHRLKDLARPERVYQLVAPDLPGTFPPLTADAPAQAPPLPVPLGGDDAPPVGREREQGLLHDALDRAL